MELPPRSEGPVADAQRALEQIELDVVWLNVVCALLVERLEKQSLGENVIIDFEEIEAAEAPELVQDLHPNDKAWILSTYRPGVAEREESHGERS